MKKRNKLLMVLFTNMFLVFTSLMFSQPKITYTQDLKKTFTKKNIKHSSFKTFKNTINNGLNNGIYWFKITNINKKHIVQFPSNHISKGIAFYKNEDVFPEKNERFLTFIVKQSPTFIKLNITKEAHIPITIQDYSAYIYANKKDNLYIGFYYGFAFIVVLINLFYFINFRDKTFLYYALFLFGVSTSLWLSDGILTLFNYSQHILTITSLLTHITTSFLGVLFATSYLQTPNYYPKLRYLNVVFLLVQLFLFIMYVATNSFFCFVLIETLSFTLVGIYWLVSVLLFKKNVFTKVFTVAYVFILLLGVDYYVLKLFGFQLLHISRSYIKIAGFFEMILLSFAVIYRMKILHEENIQMRSEITQYASQISSLSEELNKNKQGKLNHFTEFDLSEREQKIFTFLTQGKSNKEIAEVLFISVNTVKYHIKKIYSKLNIKSREEAKKIAII